jgi:hypothetical protein
MDVEILKGMPAGLNAAMQRHLRFRGVDILSGTGGIVSASHTEDDIEQATAAFQETVLALLREEQIHRLR